jgi:hypothetical protein
VIVQHSSRSPSRAAGYWACPGKPAAEEGLPDVPTIFAAEGKCAHLISDLCLKTGLSAFDFVGCRTAVDEFRFEWTDADAEWMQPGLNRVTGFEGQLFSELRVDMSPWLGADEGGTLDRAVVSRDLIVIDDLKWGWVPVSPVRNKQTMSYALGFWEEVARHLSPATDFLLSIDQPRCSGGGGTWRVTLDELLAFGEELKRRVALSRQPNAPRRGSDVCRNCRRFNTKGGCYEADRFCLEVMGMAPETVDKNDAICAPPLMLPTLDGDRRAYIIRHSKLVEAWLERQRDDALTDALTGHEVPGMKAVNGNRPPRKWKDPETIGAALIPILGDKRWAPPKIKTPTQVEKELGRAAYVEKIEDLVDPGEPKPVLVPVDDARRAIESLASRFEELPERAAA